MKGHILVGGWPGAGKTVLARALAEHLALPYLSKDELKESLMDALGAPSTVEESRRLGRAAVFAVLRMAAGCPGAVVDSTWYPYARSMVNRLAGPLVEVRCRVDLAVARERFHGRQRDDRHLDPLRSEEELWGSDVPALGVGPLVEVDTTGPVDVPALARRVECLLRDDDSSGQP